MSIWTLAITGQFDLCVLKVFKHSQFRYSDACSLTCPMKKSLWQWDDSRLGDGMLGTHDHPCKVHQVHKNCVEKWLNPSKDARFKSLSCTMFNQKSVNLQPCYSSHKRVQILDGNSPKYSEKLEHFSCSPTTSSLSMSLTLTLWKTTTWYLLAW